MAQRLVIMGLSRTPYLPDSALSTNELTLNWFLTLEITTASEFVDDVYNYITGLMFHCVASASREHFLISAILDKRGDHTA